MVRMAPRMDATLALKAALSGGLHHDTIVDACLGSLQKQPSLGLNFAPSSRAAQVMMYSANMGVPVTAEGCCCRSNDVHYL